MEDLDHDREVPGAADRILRTLERFGFRWDGSVVYQSRRTDLYRAALERLRRLDRAYDCSCTRRDLRRLPRNAGGESIYPGTCRGGSRSTTLPPAVRFRTDLDAQPVCVEDEFQGVVCQDVSTDVGDFVIRRRDGYFAYQLAVVVDDAGQGITEVVRGCDLLDNTPRQVQLQRALGVPTPRYAHLPLVVEPGGRKLAKSRRSVAVDDRSPASQLAVVLDLLGQSPPGSLASAPVSEVWDWAFAHWQPAALRGRREVEAPAR
jgi:glutamyl-Q tRNA(Asp) synthetase